MVVGSQACGGPGVMPSYARTGGGLVGAGPAAAKAGGGLVGAGPAAAKAGGGFVCAGPAAAKAGGGFVDAGPAAAKGCDDGGYLLHGKEYAGMDVSVRGRARRGCVRDRSGRTQSLPVTTIGSAGLPVNTIGSTGKHTGKKTDVTGNACR